MTKENGCFRDTLKKGCFRTGAFPAALNRIMTIKVANQSIPVLRHFTLKTYIPFCAFSGAVFTDGDIIDGGDDI